jgi:hypothetical protein
VHIEFLVEELSAEAALKNLVPKILGEEVTFQIHPYQGKQNLLRKLPDRLKGYKKWLPDDWRIVVLIDTDRQDCKLLKHQLEEIASNAGLITKSAAPSDRSFQVLNRLAIEELEAWFFGDVEAIATAYPGVSPKIAQKERFRNPDAITGGTWEALEKLLQSKGYHRGGLEKVNAARQISQHMNPDCNRCKSFEVFRDGLLKMVELDP